jgi:glycosyltransferase involved in cell wall biosynthesis
MSMPRQDKIKIHQFHSGSSVADAVTNCMFFVRSMLKSFGFASDIFVEHVDSALAGRVRPLEELRPAKSDLLLIHHSMGHDAFRRLAEQRCRKFLVYHNITPPRFFHEKDPFHFYGVKGYAQLSQFRDIVESAIAVSPFNATQLEQRGFQNVTVIPFLKDFTAIRNAPHARTPYYDQSAVFRLLFVGRLVPHKCQHELVEFVERVRSIGNVPLALVLVGQFDEADSYKSHLDALVRRTGLDQQVTITGQVTDEELFGWYRAASAYVSPSEHEGFGVPLVEAMAFDLPVIAYDAAAVPDTLGDAGITLSKKDPAEILESLVRLHEDRLFRREVIRRQRQRLLRFGRERIEGDLRRWLIGAGADDCLNGDADLDTAIDDQPLPSRRTHYVIEGPFETSYSLAIVNRNLALALDTREACASYIEPADGTEDYSVDTAAAAKLTPEIAELVRPAPVTAERLVTIRNTYPPRPNGLLGDVRLLHLAWEESAIPDTLAELINLHLDGILAPSEYSKRAIRNSGVRLPIGVIGHGIDHSGLMPRVIGDRAKVGPVTHALPFTFLHISSGLARKGIEELITAYCLAFSRRDPVLLVIKTFDNPTNIIDITVERFTSQAEYAPAIQVISEELDQRQIDFLYHVADALVLPTRGEGFNLPAAEGMARGVPVIVTRHSGHLDFCNDGNSFLIDCAYDFSTSHLNIPNSFWARPSVEQLIRTMKMLYRDGRSPDTITASRAAQGREDALRLRWAAVGARVDAFVQHFENRPVMRRKLRLAWVSTYNAQCGIAAYSKHLLEFFDKGSFEIIIIADDQQVIGQEPDNIVRLWSKSSGDLSRVTNYLMTNAFDAVVFQHNFALFDFEELLNTLTCLHTHGIMTFITLHRTPDLENNHVLISTQQIIDALHNCTRIFVHGLDDINRLRVCGVTANVVLLAHGVIDRPALNADAVASLLGLTDFSPIIGTFGFLLPGKGLTELIHGFCLLLRVYPAAHLLMINADYPARESQELRERCQALIRLLELEGSVSLVNEFLDVEEALFLLSACDAIVFPYQRSEESASGAIRFGLAAGRPVLATPLPIFSDLSGIVYQLPGTEAKDIAKGIASLLADEDRKAEVLQRQRDWMRANSWAAQAARMSNIIRGCFQETHGVELRAPEHTRSVLTPSPEDELQSPASSDLLRGQDLAAIAKLLGRRAIRKWDRMRAARSSFEIANTPPITGTCSGEPKDVSSRFISQADRARDLRDWVLAGRYYQKALDQKPDNPPIWVQYGHALKESGKLQEAEAAYRRSVELAPDVADTHLQLGHVLKIQGRKIEASAAYLRALVLDPGMDHASFELRNLGWTRGRIQFALRREQSGQK